MAPIRSGSRLPAGRTICPAPSRIDFFVFDWYFNVAVNDPGENLNSGLQISQALSDRHPYAILYVDSPPFDVGPADWPSAINEWIPYMQDPAYVCVNSLPVLFIINVGEMLQIWGSDSAVSGALAQLRSAVKAAGLPGVYIVCGFGVPDGTMGQASLGAGFSIAGTDGYDAIAFTVTRFPRLQLMECCRSQLSLRPASGPGNKLRRAVRCLSFLSDGRLGSSSLERNRT